MRGLHRAVTAGTWLVAGPGPVASDTAMRTLTWHADEVADPVDPSAHAWVTR